MARKLCINPQVLGTVWALGYCLSAQPMAAQDQLGIQARANAANQMIILGVQQGISAMPPTSGQSFTYDYNSETGTFEATEALGPTVFRTAETIGGNRLSIRTAASYFQLGETFGPIPYLDVPTDVVDSTQVTRLGMQASANVAVLNVGGTYGIGDRFELSVNLPVTIVDAQASSLNPFVKGPNQVPTNLAEEMRCGGGTERTPVECNQQISRNLRDGTWGVNNQSFKSLGYDFNEGTSVGFGRSSLGGKGLLWAPGDFSLAGEFQFFFPSPSQDEFAGSDSASILPRLIAEYRAAKHLNLYTDVGYDWNWDEATLTRFVWDAGVSFPIVNATFDFGFGGSLFDESLTWTPKRVSAKSSTGGNYILTAFYPDQTELGTNYVDALCGLKVKLTDQAVLSGSVVIPVTSDGFRAAAIGTAALEVYFNL